MTGARIHIRLADARDHGLLAELGERTFRDTFARDNTPDDMAAYLASSFSPEIQAAELADPATTYLIAVAEAAAVGYARLVRGPAPACVSTDRPMEIRRIYSVADWIGRGVGSALMRASLDESARQECDAIWLDVWEKNASAIAFYTRWGFVQVGLQPFVLGSDVQHDLLMARPVTASVEARGGMR